ncbi:putative ribonuclease H-like domain-containing protein [Tanacetum coccineum]
MITQNPKVDRRDWNGQMTQKLRLGFGFTKKACFVCGSYSHLIKDYDFHEKRMAKSVLKYMEKVTGHREVRPVWNNTQRINNQNKFVPSTVLTRFGRVPVSAAKQSSFRAAASTGAVKQVNTATNTNRVNVSKTRTSIFHKSTAPNTSISNEKVNTVRVKGVNTAGQTTISAVKGNGVTVVKASACCVWRPKMTDLNNVSKDNSGSWVSKRGNPQQALKNKGIFDNRCSRHMTGNKDFLTDYQELDGGFVAFGGGTRGGKITGLQETNGNTGLKKNVDAGQSEEKNVSTQQYIVFPLCTPVYVASAPRTSNDAGPSSISLGRFFLLNVIDLPDDPLMPNLEDTVEVQNTGIFGIDFDDEDLDTYNSPFADQVMGAEADFNNMEPSTIVSPIPTTRVHYIHPKDQIIGDPKEGQITKIAQALDDESWVEAMQEELLQFKIQKVWTLVDLPYGKKAIGTKWVYRNKKDERGIVVRNKARLVAQGYKQEE